MKTVKWLVIILLVSISIYAAWIGVALYRLPSVAGLADPEMNLAIQVKDRLGEFHPSWSENRIPGGPRRRASRPP